MRRLYHFDEGNEQAFYTAVFDAYKDETAYLFSSAQQQTALDDCYTEVTEDEEKARRVLKKINAIDRRAAFEVSCILRTPYPDREQTAFLYIRLLVQTSAPVRGKLTVPAVRRAMDLVYKVTGETHNMKGFLRFQETEGGVFYAPFSPDNDVLDLLMPHFLNRFQGVPFVIHDVARGLAGIGKEGKFFIVPAAKATVTVTAEESFFCELWRSYYSTVAITARKNEKQMKKSMPVRYWKFLPEKQDGLFL